MSPRTSEARPLDARARRQWPELPEALPVGSWFVGVEGELRVLPGGEVAPRPTPWPWTRPSAAAIPTAGRRP